MVWSFPPPVHLQTSQSYKLYARDVFAHKAGKCWHELKQNTSCLVAILPRVHSHVFFKVKKLQKEKDYAEEELHKLRLEFEAFRVHTSQLIADEKDLNAKLRNNIMTS